jgi:formylglycine-generating enzyme required for sulfatase activity
MAELDAPTMVLPAPVTASPMVSPSVAAKPVPAKTALVDAPPATGGEPSPPPPAPRPTWLMPAALGVIVAVGVGIYVVSGVGAGTGKSPSKPAPATATLAKVIDARGGAMVLVEAGSFLSGENKQPDTLPAFYIDKTEVSNAAYAQFCAETKHALPKGFEADKPEYPVVNVLILDARAFAQWAGKRLPKGREWEKAARGKDGYLYPWGNEPDTARANVGSGRLLKVSDLPAGASPYGSLNMSGNVWELVDEVSPPGNGAFAEFTRLFRQIGFAPPTRSEQWYMVRGQSYSPEEKLVPEGLWDFSTVPERGSTIHIGFRCVKDAV